jgi:polyisoprenoid-binding protein YceI
MSDAVDPTDADQPDTPRVPEPADGADSGGRGWRPVRWITGGVLVLALGAAGYIGWTQVKPTIEARKYANVTDEVPEAPRLTAEAGEQLFRIDPTRSSLTYEIEERFVGRSASTATGTTKAVAGDLAINEADLEASRVGTIVVDIEQFRSDNNLRDARIRKDFLESHTYPLATFDLTGISGLSGSLDEGAEATFQIEGNVTIRDQAAPATFDVTASYVDGELTATATTTAKLSRFDAGPISIAGLVTTSDEVKLTLELTAVDPATSDVATEVAVDERVGTGDAPSFSKDVLPIIEANCASCHNPGQMASDTIRIETAADVAAISDGIKTVTQTRYMPPWPASDAGVELLHDPRLSDEDLATLAAWSDAGGPLDVDASTPVEMTEEAAGLLPRKDQTVRIEPYTGVQTNTNDYRCFVLDPGLTEEQFLTGYTFEPDVLRQIHHVQVFQITESQKETAAQIAGKDGRSGWQCYAGPSLRGERVSDRLPDDRKPDVGFPGQADLVAGWVPGQSPVIFPENSGIQMLPGDALVIQVHYHFAKEPVPDSSGLSLQWDDPGDVRRLRVVNPLAPVEIPCAPEDADAPLCDRTAAMRDNVRLYGPSGASNEIGLLGLCRHTADELAATFDGNVARSDCNLRVPEDGTLVSVLGHMHTIGDSLRLTLDADTPDEKVLLDIPDWNFDWQMNYGLAEPIEVKAGQAIRLECSWDRRKDPGRDPKYIVFAEGTEDEMCFATYAIIPKDQ